MRIHLKLGLLLAVVALAALVALTACGGGGDGEEEPVATTPAGETPTQAPTVERLTPTPEGPTREAAASPAATINWCDLVTTEEVEEALGESVTDTEEVGDVACRYMTDPINVAVQIEQGTQQIFEEGMYGEYAASGREPVPGIGDEAAWFGLVAPFFLSVHEGDLYFQVRLLLPEVDSATQLEIAKELAAIAVERLP
jgi:predicted small lipoprotein YifL